MGSEVIIVPSAFLMIAYVFYVVANAFTRRQQLRSTTEFQTKLLERMGTMGEFSQFLNTEGGQKLLGTVGERRRLCAPACPARVPVRHRHALPRNRHLPVSERRAGRDRDTYESLGFVGTVSAAVGMGLLISGYVSLKLSRKMGLINGKSHASGPE